MSAGRSACRAPGGRHAAGGMVLIVALVVLMAMLLAAYAMLRATGASSSIAGNLAFKQNATLAADAGVEEAMRWLALGTSVTTARVESSAPFYFPTWEADFDSYTFDWSDTQSRKVSMAERGMTARYVIHRLCSAAGAVASGSATQRCTLVPSKYVMTSVGCKSEEDPACSSSSTVYFRVTVRVEGPRNTLSYVQVLLF